jgi:O-antigen/teichoic acid export membrane protein
MNCLNLLKSRGGKHSMLVLFANSISALFAFIAIVIMSRTLGAAGFGLFSIFFAVMTIATQLSDFGLSTSLVRFAAKHLGRDNVKADLVFKVAWQFQLVVSLLISAVGLLISPLLARHIFSNDILLWPLRLAFIGSFGASLTLYIISTLTARQAFNRFAIVKLIVPFGKMSIIALLCLIYRLNLLSSVATYAILPFIAFIIGAALIPKNFLKVEGDVKTVFFELYHFNKWIVLSVLSVILFSKLDILMLGYFKSPEIVGRYSAAYTLAFIFPLITGSITTVLLPKVSRFNNIRELRSYVKKIVGFTIPVIIPLGIMLILSKYLILHIYGDEYLTSAVIFQILIIGFAFTIIINPISLIIYSINKPRQLTFLNIAQLILNFILNLLLIPSYGAIGAALATLAVNLMGTMFISVYIYRYLRRHPILEQGM